MMKPSCVILVAVLTLAGCANGGYNSAPMMNNAAVRTVGGAGAGALIADVTGGSRTKGALIGAVAGGLSCANGTCN